MFIRFVKGTFIALVFVAFVGPAAFAQNVYTAESCNQSAVNTLINGPTHTAVNGDIIVIPAGTCTWTSGITINVSITLAGSGSPNAGPSTFGAGTLDTIILDDVPSTGPLFQVEIPYVSGALFRLTTLDIEPESSTTSLFSPISIAGTCTSSGCPNVRVDNIGLGLTTQWNESGNSSNAATMLRCDNIFGVLDHNTQPTGSTVWFANISLSSYLGVGSFGDNSWAQADSFGTGNELYMENNSIYTQESVNDAEFAPVGGGIGGGRVAGRFNQINPTNGFFVAFTFHGLDTTGRNQGGRSIEAYGNTINCQNGSCGGGVAGFRSGTGIVFGNNLEANYTATGGFFDNVADMTVYRTVYTATGGWGPCGGSSPYDINDGASVTSASTLTAVGSGTVTDSSQSWTTNQFAPGSKLYLVYDITRSTGNWVAAEIASNTANTLTVATNSNWSPASGDSYVIVGSTLYFSGTATSGSSGVTLNDTSQVWVANQFIPSGAPFSVYDVTQNFWAEIASNTITSLTIASSIPEQNNSFSSGDTYRILRSTVCTDQGGRGPGTLFSGANGPTPASASNQALDPIYEWDDTAHNLNGGNIGTDTGRTIANRDWYTDGSNGSPQAQTTDATPFNGTTGVGFGLLGNKPATCIPSVGYFATDQGSWNSSGNGFGQGELFVCTALNTWTLHYVPYSYPHPLTYPNSPVLSAQVF